MNIDVAPSVMKQMVLHYACVNNVSSFLIMSCSWNFLLWYLLQTLLLLNEHPTPFPVTSGKSEEIFDRWGFTRFSKMEYLSWLCSFWALTNTGNSVVEAWPEGHDVRSDPSAANIPLLVMRSRSLNFKPALKGW